MMRYRKLLSLLLSVMLFIPVRTVSAKPNIGAKAYALMEVSSGRLLLSGNGKERLPMASTTKIMTCILAIEKGRLDSEITVSKNAAGTEGSSMYLKEGEILTLRQLLYGLMIVSGNDAAVAVAEGVSGSVDEFVEEMNKKALELGLENTHFVTPNGLHDDMHYTSAEDLALLSCYALKNPIFADIVSTRRMVIEETERNSAHWLNSKNRILSEYDGGCGVKTGYTKKAGRCLSASAVRDGMQLVAVVLSDGEMFNDCEALLDYGFSNYPMRSIAVSGKTAGRAAVACGTKKLVSYSPASSVILPLTEDEYKMISVKYSVPAEISAPVYRSDKIGTLSVLIGGEVVCEVPLLADDSVPENTFGYNLRRVIRDMLFLSDPA